MDRIAWDKKGELKSSTSRTRGGSVKQGKKRFRGKEKVFQGLFPAVRYSGGKVRKRGRIKTW